MFAMLVAIGLSAPPAEPQKEKEKDLPEAAQKELKKFAGKWKAIELHVDGNEQKPELDGNEVIFEFKGRKFLLNGNELLGVDSLDPSTNPKCIDLKGLMDLGGVKKDTVYEGIYKLDGDKLTLAVNVSELKKRPEKFESPKDSMVVVVTLKKEKE